MTKPGPKKTNYERFTILLRIWTYGVFGFMLAGVAKNLNFSTEDLNFLPVTLLSSLYFYVGYSCIKLTSKK